MPEARYSEYRMELKILPRAEYHGLLKQFYNTLAEEATDEFWVIANAAYAALRKHLQRFGEENVAWEIAEHCQRNRMISACLFADSLYTPELLPGIAAAIPQDAKPWCAGLECYTDARMLPNGQPLCIGWLAITDNVVYTSEDYEALIGFPARLGLEVS